MDECSGRSGGRSNCKQLQGAESGVLGDKGCFEGEKMVGGNVASCTAKDNPRKVWTMKSRRLMRWRWRGENDARDNAAERENVVNGYNLLKGATRTLKTGWGTVLRLRKSGDCVVDENEQDARKLKVLRLSSSSTAVESFGRYAGGDGRKVFDNMSNATLVNDSALNLTDTNVRSTATLCSASPVTRYPNGNMIAGGKLEGMHGYDELPDATDGDAVSVADGGDKSYSWAKSYMLGRARHLHYYELPQPWRENPYIIYGHRFYHSHKKSLLSILNVYGWHNETINIWSHIAGAIILLYIMLRGFPNSDVFNSTQVPKVAKGAIYVFLLCGIKCMVSSVMWHTFSGTCHLPLRSRFSCVDYTGITILITASVMTTEAFTLYRLAPKAMYLYMGISLCLGVFAAFTNWSRRFDGPDSRIFRVAFYVILAGLGLISFVHLTVHSDWSSSRLMITPLINKSIVWYLIGVVFYATLVPERWRSRILLSHPVQNPVDTNFPSSDSNIPSENIDNIHFKSKPKESDQLGFWSLWWVDYFCHSHFLWHIFVVLGVVGHYRATLAMARMNWLDTPSIL
ncbi:Izh3p Ecym_7109 [Eremothecium cymbalariae DBVPG|uniref:Uncharacterized protein n=1 Tax=Eremothecium cymbalariae (strain CBS 270.75 / DBVPG 7215 / KCTC 17166 / NRRL Y-17582) TaxID=931890 RepID=G8JVU6_ERECY|nr:hypothetical protein Ecym_7109 [Eremothecium cymbalariae DBVPG\